MTESEDGTSVDPAVTNLESVGERNGDGDLNSLPTNDVCLCWDESS